MEENLERAAASQEVSLSNCVNHRLNSSSLLCIKDTRVSVAPPDAMQEDLSQYK